MVFWVIFGVLLVGLLAVLEHFFKFAHLRKPEEPVDPERLSGPWKKYWGMIREGMDWIESHETETVTVTSFDGLKLHGLYIPAERPRACVLLFHGYRSTGRKDYAALVPYYNEHGLSVLVVDQRACGESEGRYIAFGALERRDAVTWAEYMADRLGDLPLVLEGISMGATTVMLAAGLPLPKTVRGVIADCGFTSPFDIIAHCAKKWFHLPTFPLVYLLSGYCRLRAGFGYRDCSTLDALAKSRLPVCMIHGAADDFVPTYMTEQNHAAAAGPKKKLVVPEAGHGLSYLLDMAGCRRELLAFMDYITGEAAEWPTKS